MHTSLLLVALLGPGAAPRALESPKWETSYRAGRETAREQHKPMAVFVGTGAEGWKKACPGGLSAEAQKALEDYVCVYVDSSQPEGQRLANTLEMSSGTGVVLSCGHAESQAFWHDGTLSSAELERSLKRYAKGPTITRTETLAQTRFAYSGTAESLVPAATIGYAVAPGMTGYIRYPIAGAMMGNIGYAGYAATGYAAPAYTAPIYGAVGGFAPSYGHGGYVGGYGYSGGYSYGGGCGGGRCR
jgi:hypothetical protein